MEESSPIIRSIYKAYVRENPSPKNSLKFSGYQETRLFFENPGNLLDVNGKAIRHPSIREFGPSPELRVGKPKRIFSLHGSSRMIS